MKLVLIIGDTAVGKMTVGQELAKITDLRLFHNHMMIELVLEVFGYFNGKAITGMREVIFEEFANSEHYGLIFTYMWAFDQQSDWDYVEYICNIFRKHNADIYYVELVAPQAIRLQRNATENRLKNKASKRDIEMSNQRLINDDRKYRCVSNDGEIPYDNYIKIDNTNLSAEIVAKTIKEQFGL
ncbi:MAG: AAA family ATPase [Clostridium argentinense]|uniref:AAA family ATPase n=1 Tax=Clostridium faecium TaxID=2762223 RepID=A0ABR8YT49_9CLOT|nr:MULTISPECIES: AAA family ATPase [Clostridium]MBD8047375.1 AAA family ATPase [Clostridium faecium]MBS5823547.1 AAA family ATPase [Clostridium argentinense]MDU1350460.1 AAA family ATPase [Clostridium argentinense]